MGGRWEEFFYFSKSDRRALLVLAGVLAGIVLTSLFYGLTDRSRPAEAADSGGFAAHDAFFDSLRQDGDSAFPPREPYAQAGIQEPETFFFDPNTADSSQLLRLGLRPWQVRNIYKYRSRGGRYHRPEDFGRLYGLTKGDYDRLYPYIRIADEFRLLSDLPASAAEEKRDTAHRRSEKLAEGTQVDLNTADTTLLKKIPGIGSYYARRIADHRERLGGFVSLAQLDEVEGLPEGIGRWFVLSGMAVRPLYINRLSVERLRRHPYVNFRQARAIAEHRRKYGPVKKLQALSLYEEFTPADLERLQPYVCFDE